MTWNELIQNEQRQDYYINGIIPFLRDEYQHYTCFPVKENIFRALYAIPSPEDVKVVIIGQDPYHQPGQAMGLAFSVLESCPNPPSLKNIIQEVVDEYSEEAIVKDNTGIQTIKPCKLLNGDLDFWAAQGVLLLNASLTVRYNRPNSHADCGWQIFTDHIIEYLDKLNQPMVFMLWGKFAQNKARLLTNKDLCVLKTTHPSPLSARRGFIGCGHFKQCNNYLVQHNLTPIDWLGGINDT